MTGLPTTPKVEIEFTAGVWTDVSADVRGSEISVRYGRSSEFSAPQTATMDFVLDDLSGNYTPKNAQGSFYPNVIPRKRVRYTLSAGTVPVFFGYITSWGPQFDNYQRVTKVSAVDRLDQLGRVTLGRAADAAAIAQGASVYCPLSDATGSTSVFDAVSSSGLPAAKVFTVPDVSATVDFGGSDPMPASDGATGLVISDGVTNTSGSALQISLPSLSTTGSGTLAFWVTVPPAYATGVAGTGATVTLYDTYGGQYLYIGVRGATRYVESGQRGSGGPATIPTVGTSYCDGTPHHFAITSDGTNAKVYIDGQLATSATGATAFTNPFVGLRLQSSGVAGLTDNVSIVFGGAFVSTTALSNVAIAELFNAGCGYPNDPVGTRIQRILGWAGLSASDWTLDAGVATCGSSTWSGKDVLSALQECADVEGGGAALYVDPSGKVRFVDRSQRPKAVTPVMTIDAAADADGDIFSPTFDAVGLINESTVTRTDARSNGGTAQTYTDSASQTLYGILADSASVPTNTDVDAYLLAQDRVARRSTVGYRFPRIAVDLLTATTAGLYTALGSLVIGSRLRVTTLPTTVNGVTQFPRSQFDFFVEGWSIDSDADTYRITFDLSDADAPAMGVWNDGTYGHWATTTSTLNATITAGATSLAIATSGTPTWSTSAGDYPLTIQIDEEILTISSAPASGTSPQTVTVSRGASGTIAAAHTAGAAITVFPSATWSL